MAMAKKKWYVVTVGTAIGVFSSWLEVAPLVMGVSGARHQSFPTEEEAIRAFSDECAKGRVKVVAVASSTPSTPSRSSSHGMLTQSPGLSLKRMGSELSYLNRRTPGPSNRTLPVYLSPAATVQTPSGQGGYPSEHTRSTRASPITSLTGLSTPFRHSDTHADSPAAMRSSSSTRSLYGGRHHTDISIRAPVCDACAEGIQRRCAHCRRAVEEFALSTEMQVSHHTVYDRQVDPRSPVPNRSRLPASTHLISIGRPSPARSPCNEAGSLLLRRF